MPLLAPIMERRRILVAKIETTVGTAISVSGSDGAFNIYEPTMEEDISFEELNQEGTFENLPAAPGCSGAICKFKTDLIGGASPPAWATTFLPACAWVNSGGTYSKVASPPGANGVKTLTIGLFEDGLFKSMRGSMGKWQIVLRNGKPTMVEFEFKGIWITPSDVAMPSVTLPTTKPLKFVNSGLLVGGSWTPRVSEMTLDSGNDLQYREDSIDPSGYACALVGDTKTVGKFNPEATLVANNDVHGQLLAGTQLALALSLGTTGNQVSIAAPKMQYKKAGPGARNKVKIDEIDLQFNANSPAGGDALTITFA